MKLDEGTVLELVRFNEAGEPTVLVTLEAAPAADRCGRPACEASAELLRVNPRRTAATVRCKRHVLGHLYRQLAYVTREEFEALVARVDRLEAEVNHKDRLLEELKDKIRELRRRLDGGGQR